MGRVFGCIDGAAATAAVCDYAAWAASRLDAPLELLHAIDRHPERAPVRDLSGSIGLGAKSSLLEELVAVDEQRSRLAQEQGRQLLEGAKQRAAAAGVTKLDARQRHGPLVDTLLDMEPDARLFVLGQRHHADLLSRRHLDHDVERVIRAVRRPVLVAGETFWPPQRFAVAFDGSRSGRAMIESLARNPLVGGLACHVVMAATETRDTREQMRWARQTLAGAGLVVDLATLAGEPEAVLYDYIERHEIDLLVMGAYGHSRIRELIVGSTTTTMLRTSPAPVLIER